MINADEVLFFRELSESEACTEVYVRDISPKDASAVLQQLADLLPLQSYGLTHLKRVRRQKADSDGVCAKHEYRLQVLLCPVSEYEYLSDDTKVLTGIQDRSKLVAVQASKTAPQTRAEFESWSSLWPTLFRPTELDRDRELGTHSEDDLKLIRQYMKMVVEDEEECSRLALEFPGLVDKSNSEAEILRFLESLNVSGGIVVNPENGFIVCTSSAFYRSKFDDDSVSSDGKKASFSHPLNSTTMRCIEAVACIVRSEMESPRLPLVMDSASDNRSASADALGDNHYLCSGLDLYLDREPDLMSSMGLVHSRIRRVYFRVPEPKIGALKSNTHLHSLRELNHRYRAFFVSEGGEKKE